MIDIDVLFERDGQTFHFDVSLPSAGVTAVFGISGAGKTTFIDLIAGVVQPSQGSISVNKTVFFDSTSRTSLPIEKRGIGYVFQDDRLFPHMTVKKNITYGGHSDQRLEKLAALLDIQVLLDQYPDALSGGEKKRVAIARALMMDPRILLLDEPMSGLDSQRKQELIRYLQHLTSAFNIPILLVTHQVSEIFQLADHLVLIDRGQSICHGELNALWTHITLRPFITEGLLSSLLSAQVIDRHSKFNLTLVKIAEGVELWVNGIEHQPCTWLNLNIAANDVSITKHPVSSSIRNCVETEVIDIDNESHTSLITVELSLGGQTLLANITDWALEELGLSVGDMCYALIKGVRVTPLQCASSTVNTRQ